jgi:hypothetical protein
MALIERIIVDKIEIVGKFKHLQVRQDKQIIDDATGEIKASGNWHRYALSPDVDLSGQPADVAAIANAAWTAKIKDSYAVFKDSLS